MFNRIKTTITYLIFIRVPIIFSFIFIALICFGEEDSKIPTISNMMIARGYIGLIFAAFSTVLTIEIIGFCILHLWLLAPARIGITPLRSTLFETHKHRDIIIFCSGAALTAPLLYHIWNNSKSNLDSDVYRFLCLLAGVLIAYAVIKILFFWKETKILERFVNKFDWLAKRLGPGYWDNNKNKVEKGHGLAVGILFILSIIFVLGYFLASPTYAPKNIPVIAYVLLLLTFNCSVLSGLSFFLDRSRFPLLLGMFCYIAIFGCLLPKDHYFTVYKNTKPYIQAPSIEAAFTARRNFQREHDGEQNIITVIAASGGGIQASAWTATVLAGLQKDLGEEFTRSIYLISSTSGGSVGAYYFLEGLGENGALKKEMLEPVVSAASATSLEATAWGVVFPDFLRTVLPFLPIDETKDRAWAMERSWLRIRDRMVCGIEQSKCKPDLDKLPTIDESTRLSDWQKKAARGIIPGIVFNATIVEDGQQFLASNLDLSKLDYDQNKSPPFSSDTWNYGPFDPSLEKHYQCPYNSFDMPKVTAARLSASFPYVTPVVTARDSEGNIVSPRWHILDGGLFDNFGTVSAVRWINHIITNKDLVIPDNYKIIYIQINAFPRKNKVRELNANESKGWVNSLFGPISAFMSVSTKTQLARNDVELATLKQILGKKLEVYTFSPEPIDVDEIYPPLSWELSTMNIKRNKTDWQCGRINRNRVKRLKKHFFKNNSLTYKIMRDME